MSLLVANGACTNNNAVGRPHKDGGSTAHVGAAVTAANGSNGHLGTVAGSFAARKADAVTDKYWVAVDQTDVLGAGSGGGDGRPLLFQNKKVKGLILHPYRLLILVRLVAILLFFAWRIERSKHATVWLWAPSVAGDIYFGYSWLLNQLPKLNPIKRVPNLAALKQRYDPPDGSSRFPGIDAFVTTANPVDEPPLTTMNTVLSILAADYPVDRYACYLTDDAGALIQYEAMVETAKFAELWVPFCRKHCIEPRVPEKYFEVKVRPYTGRAPEDFVNDHRRLSREYDEFKVHINGLWNTIRRRSDMYNSVNSKEGDAKATWMADGMQWPGTWFDPAESHNKGHHAGVVKVVLNQPSQEPKLGLPASDDNPLDFSTVDVRLPMLVYMSREKHPSYNNHKKAGNLNTQLRASALLSNAPFIINFDCDHYVNNSLALRAAVCFMLDPREGDNTGFIQFPQRFDNVDPTDRYCNHNRLFFDATLLALDGFQGPSFLGTGCMFRRVALYGIDPPRWRPDNVTYKANKFGNSTSFLDSIPVAANQERSITPPQFDELVAAEVTAIVSCAYEDGTDWGRSVGFIYDIATEDVVTGFRIHRHGWRSMYCALEPQAFRGCAPINLTERLYQIMRWSAGSLEMFFSHNCPLLAGRRLHLMQRIAYLNMTTYPVTSLFILLYGLYAVMWFFPQEFYIQWPFNRYVLYLIGIIALVHMIGALEIRWAGITWLDWWRNEQFFTVGSLSVYPTAVLHVVMMLLFGKGVSFRVTSKQTTESTNDKFADLYVVRWVPLLIPAVVVLAVNVGGVGVGIGKMVVYHRVWSSAKTTHALLGIMFNVWLLVLIYPFALAMMGRWAKRPFLLFIMLVVAFIVVAITYIVIHTLLVKFVLLQREGSEHTIFPWQTGLAASW